MTSKHSPPRPPPTMNESTEKIIHEEVEEAMNVDPVAVPIPELDAASLSSESTIVDYPVVPPRPTTLQTTTNTTTTSTHPDPIGASSTTLHRKESSKSKSVGGKSFKTIRSVATRLKVANQLSIAKRAGRDDVSISGNTLHQEVPPGSASVFGSRPDFGSKQALPGRRLYADLFNSTELPMPEKEGIISGGDLLFDNDFKAKTQSRPYIYVMPDAEVKDIADVMLTEWNLPVPRIAVFILSSVGELSTWHNSRQIGAFKKGIVKAANTTSMWLVTNGLDTGVSKLIGDAIENELKERSTFRASETANQANPFHVLGIVNDHNLAYSQQFFGKTITLGSVGPSPCENRYELNQQHTQFVVLNSVNSSENGHNMLLINLIDYLTKNALRSPDEPEEEDGPPCFDQTGAASKYSTFPTMNDRFGGVNGPTTTASAVTTPVTVPPNGGLYKDFALDHLVSEDTVDHLITPETSGAPATAPDSASMMHISRQISMATLPALQPDTASAGITSKPSFVAESKPTQPPNIVEQYPVPGVDAERPRTSSSHKRDASPMHRSMAKLEPPSPATNRSVSLLRGTIIPVVCLVIQGGYECAKLVLDNLRRRNPVIVFRGSGGFADLLSYAYLEMQQRCRDMYTSWDAEFVEHTLKPLLTSKIVKRFPQFRNNALARNMFRDRILECVRESGSPKGRVYLSVLNMHNSSCNLEALSEYILLSLFKSQNRRDTLEPNIIRKDLYLTLDWNCSHVALDEVLRRNPSYNLQLEKSIFEIALVRENREDFIDLFLSHGFRVHKYLTPFRLKRLLRYTLSESEFFRSVCMESILGIAVWSLNFEEVLDKLSLNISECSDADSFLANEFNQLIYMTTSLRDFIVVEHLYMNIMGLYQVNVESTERKSLAILAMWAIFNKKYRLAQILWKHSDQPVHLGLILSMMLDRMAWFVNEANLKDELTAHSKIFANFAIGVLDACYRQDEKRSFDLLSQGNSDWDQKTAADIAAAGRHRAFIAHPCSQKWLTSTFNGSIRVRELTWGFLTVSPQIKIIFSAFFIFPMYIWIRFIDSGLAKDKRKNATLEEFHSTEGEPSDNEEDRFLPEHIKMIEVGKKEKAEENSRSPLSGEELLGQMGNHRSVKDTARVDTFRQRHLFIKKQPPLRSMIFLMWTAPITKFWTMQVFYILFLALYSLAVIWPGCGNWYLDATVCIWIFLQLVEQVRRTVALFKRFHSLPIFFKILEMVALITLCSVYSVGRVFVIDGRSFTNLFDPYTMKVLLCLGLLYFYYRLFAIHLPISPTLGPLLYRFRLMVSVDFIHFMRMALILLISGGIVIQAILYPNTELSIDMFHKAFHRSAISLFLTPVEELTVKCNRSIVKPAALFPSSVDNGNVSLFERKFIFDIRPDQCPAQALSMAESCPRTGFWAYFFTFQFLISLKLILLTLLYALFASTASRLQSDTDHIWKFQRYTLVVDCTTRGALCAPLSIFQYAYEIALAVFHLLTCRCIKCGRRKGDHVDGKVLGGGAGTEVCTDDVGGRLSREDYNFWRHLAKTYYEEEIKVRQKTDVVVKQAEMVQLICEEMEHSKHVLRGLKTKITEMERLIYQTHIHLENIQHSTTTCPSGGSLTTTQPLSTSGGGVHYLSRHSPYVGTRIQRFPLADKYVSWDVIWINYDPVIYSRKREDFPVSLKPFVDEDILAIKERLNSVFTEISSHEKFRHLPVFNWNAVSVNPAGLTYDRRSWLVLPSKGGTEEDSGDNRIIYKLDDGIPLNPFGRTGLRGKGNLPRWGPNHYVLVVLTRSKSTVGGGLLLEFALELKANVLALPMRFVGDDKPFGEIRHLLAKDDRDVHQQWSSEEEMIQYFSERVQRSPPGSVSVKCEPSIVHYMDSPDNTDNAWKEVQLYHVHFTLSGQNTALTDNLIHSSLGSSQGPHSTLVWLISTEDLLVRIPMEQVSFMNAIIRRLQPSTT